jgi:hypothetical protein
MGTRLDGWGVLPVMMQEMMQNVVIADATTSGSSATLSLFG